MLHGTDWIKFAVLIVIAIIFVTPIFLVLMNSFKGKLFVSNEPFAFPNSESFVGFDNYTNGVEKIGFFPAFINSVIITLGSVVLLIICTSMCAWFITRVKTWYTKLMYLLFAFSMIVPFQMVMYPMSFIANTLKLDNLIGIMVIYLGFGAGLSVFMFAGFIKSGPLEIEEAAAMDGCGPIRTFFQVVLPMLKPTMISVGILEIMWIWNDYLLPYLSLNRTEYMTIPIHIQYLQGSYGAVDLGAIMALITLSILPVIIFYLICQKYIIKGVAAGAVKG